MVSTFENKDTINMLTPIDNIFGTHEGRLGPTLKFLLVAATPFLIWVVMLQMIIPFRFMLIFEVLWSARMALIILGKEKEKYQRYIAAKKDKYSDAYKLVRIAHQYDNSLIEYENGNMCVALVGYVSYYANDNVFANDMKKFFDFIDQYQFDLYLHQFVNEFQLQSESERLRVYSDKGFMSERMQMLKDQDDFVNKHSQLYRYTFLLKASPYKWKELLEFANAICESNVSKVFKGIHLATREEFSEIASRDLGTHLSITDMLRHKYINDDYNGSKVLWYGDKVPKKYQVKKEEDDTSKRRVIYVEENDEE